MAQSFNVARGNCTPQFQMRDLKQAHRYGPAGIVFFSAEYIVEHVCAGIRLANKDVTQKLPHGPGKRMPLISGVSIMMHKNLLQYFAPLILLLPGPATHAQTEQYQFINGSTCDFNGNTAAAVAGSHITGLGTTIYCAIPQPLTPTPNTGPLPVLTRVAFEGENTSVPGVSGSVTAQACIFISTARFVVVRCGPPSTNSSPGRFSDTVAVPIDDEATGAYIAFTFREGIQSFIYQAQAFWTRNP